MSTTAYRVVIILFCCLLPLSLVAQSPYEYGSDSQRQDGVPQGVVTKHVWDHSEVFPGTVRDYWIYVPVQYDKSKPACLMILHELTWLTPHSTVLLKILENTIYYQCRNFNIRV